MHGFMQRRNLLISSVLEHADRHHGAAEVVSHRDNGALSRTTYAELASRARRLARVLIKRGVRPGDRVATLAMNSDRQLELYYAISGIGAICNTINPRLSHDDIAIAHHAEDGLIFVDPDFLPIVAAVAPRLPALRRVVMLADAAPTCEMSLPGGIDLHVYEARLRSRTSPLGTLKSPRPRQSRCLTIMWWRGRVVVPNPRHCAISTRTRCRSGLFRVVIVESIPRGATGKILKSELRRMFSGTRSKD